MELKVMKTYLSSLGIFLLFTFSFLIEGTKYRKPTVINEVTSRSETSYQQKLLLASKFNESNLKKDKISPFMIKSFEIKSSIKRRRISSLKKTQTSNLHWLVQIEFIDGRSYTFSYNDSQLILGALSK